MNVVLAAYYGTVPFEKISAQMPKLDISEVVALRHLYDQFPDRSADGLLKVSDLRQPPAESKDTVAQAVEILGGADQAINKLSQALPWLTSWMEGEADGIALAASIIENEFDEARARHTP